MYFVAADFFICQDTLPICGGEGYAVYNKTYLESRNCIIDFHVPADFLLNLTSDVMDIYCNDERTCHLDIGITSTNVCYGGIPCLVEDLVSEDIQLIFKGPAEITLVFIIGKPIFQTEGIRFHYECE